MNRKIAAASILAAALAGLSACASSDAAPEAVATVKPVAATPTVPAVCVGVPQTMMKDCIALAARPATKSTLPDGSAEVEEPAGEALVTECRSQYTGEELATCLR
jgi:curli biogenesis system outer membrane secretion channel CsgG